jgi:hypothetical protein
VFYRTHALNVRKLEGLASANGHRGINLSSTSQARRKWGARARERPSPLPFLACGIFGTDRERLGIRKPEQATHAVFETVERDRRQECNRRNSARLS